MASTVASSLFRTAFDLLGGKQEGVPGDTQGITLATAAETTSQLLHRRLVQHAQEERGSLKTLVKAVRA